MLMMLEEILLLNTMRHYQNFYNLSETRPGKMIVHYCLQSPMESPVAILISVLRLAQWTWASNGFIDSYILTDLFLWSSIGSSMGSLVRPQCHLDNPSSMPCSLYWYDFKIFILSSFWLILESCFKFSTIVVNTFLKTL